MKQGFPRIFALPKNRLDLLYRCCGKFSALHVFATIIYTFPTAWISAICGYLSMQMQFFVREMKIFYFYLVFTTGIGRCWKCTIIAHAVSFTKDSLQCSIFFQSLPNRTSVWQRKVVRAAVILVYRLLFCLFNELTHDWLFVEAVCLWNYKRCATETYLRLASSWEPQNGNRNLWFTETLFKFGKCVT